MTATADRLLGDTPREAEVERYLVAQVTRLGGECLKNTGQAGVPDRLVLLPGGSMVFIEVKRLGERPSRLQKRFLDRMHRLQIPVAAVDSRDAVDRVLRERAWS